MKLVEWSGRLYNQDQLFTLEDYLALPDDTRMELTGGVLRPMARAHTEGRQVQTRLTIRLEEQCPPEYLVALEEIVVFHEVPPEARIPDVSVFARIGKVSRTNHVAARHMLLAVEIVSPGSEYDDRRAKPAEYADNGIPHFWRIELDPEFAVLGRHPGRPACVPALTSESSAFRVRDTGRAGYPSVRIYPDRQEGTPMRSWHLAGTVAAMIMLWPGLAAAAEPEPAAQDDLSNFESATVVSGLAVVVERDSGRVVAERDTHYTIGVSNRGEEPQTFRIRVTVPPWMAEATPHDGGELGKGFVEWPVTVAPGEAAALRMTGAYTAPDRDTPTRVAFTACALGTEDNEPIVCATDIARLESASSGATRWWLAGLAVVLVAAAVGGYLLWRRRARPQAEPETPAVEPETPAVTAG
jgi:Uma2 family endonuclease